jgi:hypothetical protein
MCFFRRKNPQSWQPWYNKYLRLSPAIFPRTRTVWR